MCRTCSSDTNLTTSYSCCRRRVFSHKSYCISNDYSSYIKPDNCIELRNTSYETLEFLGDSLLGSIIAEYLYTRYYDIFNQNEGFLTKLKNKIVNGESLSKLSLYLGFDKFMIISKHIEENCNGRKTQSILEDIFEAFIGAFYLDTNDYMLLKQFICSVIESFIDFSDLIINDTNYKDQLLRYFQNIYKEHPKYNTDNPVVQGNNNIFTSYVVYNNNIVASGTGETKKKSEQDASKNALIKYGILN